MLVNKQLIVAIDFHNIWSVDGYRQLFGYQNS